MLDRTDNPRAVIGDNQCPGALTLAEAAIEALRDFLKDNPVVSNEEEARAGKAILDRTSLALKGIEDERKEKVDPINAQLRELNARYHKWHSTNPDKPGIWDKLFKELRGRLTSYARAEEAKRIAAAEAARRAAEDAERKAREAEAREREAAATAATGVCDVDIGAATQEADDAFRAFQRAGREAQRAERDTKVRLAGGFGKATSLRDKEILTVTDWQAAIKEFGLTDRIRDAILTEARAFRTSMGDLPAGITATYDRSL
jgi:hypothetical protein